MDAYPPDHRRRDIDNLIKATADALQHAGVYEDDSQVDLLVVRRCEPDRPRGHVEVRVEELPLTRCPLCGAALDPETN
jgi:crossover junction endodeoxyribonuclease RusA